MLARVPNLLQINHHSVSITVFIGIFAAFLPIPGQTILAIIMSICSRANVPIAALIVWLSNPFTIAPMIYLSYRLGSSLTYMELIDFSVIANWEWFSIVGSKIFIPLMIGGVILGLICGILSNFLVLQAWRFKLIKNLERRYMKRQPARDNNSTIN